MTLSSVSRLRSFLESRRLADDPIAVLSSHVEKLGDDFLYYFGGMKQVRVTANPAVLRRILKDNYENYRKSDIQVRWLGHFLGTSSVILHDEEWLRQRRLTQRGFTVAALTALSEGMHSSLNESVARLGERTSESIDIAREMSAITFAMVTRALFGERMTAEESATIADAVTHIQDFVVRQVTRPYLVPWYAISGEQRRHEAMRDEAFSIVRRHIRLAQESSQKGSHILQILLDGVDPQTGEGMNEQQVLYECMQLVVAGSESASAALTWTLYLLERNPEYLQRVREEFDTVLGAEPLAHHHFARLTLSTRIVEEAMRLYPPIWMIDRTAVGDDPDVNVRAGDTIVMFLYGAHRSADSWRDPGRFLPERIGESDRNGGRDFTYLPFGGGPRRCVGANFAMLQMLTVLSVILRRFEFSIENGRDVKANPMLVLRQQPDTRARVRRR